MSNPNKLSIRGASRKKWLEGAGKKFIAGLRKISFALSAVGLGGKDLTKLASMKAQGYAAKEVSEVIVNFNLAQASAQSVRLAERVFESKVKKEEAEARLAELNMLNAELDLLDKLKKLDVKLYCDESGTLTVIPRSLALPAPDVTVADVERAARNLYRKIDKPTR